MKPGYRGKGLSVIRVCWAHPLPAGGQRVCSALLLSPNTGSRIAGAGACVQLPVC